MHDALTVIEAIAAVIAIYVTIMVMVDTMDDMGRGIASALRGDEDDFDSANKDR